MRRLLMTAGCLAAAGCAGGGAAGPYGAANAPAPQAGTTSTTGTGVSAAPNVGGRGAAITYRPFDNVGYTFHRLDSLTLHLPGGALQQESLERTAFLRVSLVAGTGAGAGSYRTTIVLDSLRAVASAVPVPADSVAPARGTRWTATIGADGRLSAIVADRSSTLGDQLTNQLRLLFPHLPTGGARAGAEWADSTEFPLKADAFDATERARTTYRASEDGTGKGLKIESVAMYTRAGKGKRYNQQLEMTSSGKRQSVHRIGRDGVLLGADGSESGSMTITVPSAGQTVPVDQSSRYEIRPTGR